MTQFTVHRRNGYIVRDYNTPTNAKIAVEGLITSTVTTYLISFLLFLT